MPRYRRLSATEREAAFSRLAAGAPLAAVARELRLGRPTVRWLAREAGLARRADPAARVARDAAIRELAAAGCSLRLIAQRLGVDQATVRRVLTRERRTHDSAPQP